jgi:hypothetical protein
MSSSEPDDEESPSPESSQEEAKGEVGGEEHRPPMVPSMTDSALTVDVSGASSDVAVASGHPSEEGAFVGDSSDDSFLKEAVSGMRIHEWNSGLKQGPLIRSLVLIHAVPRIIRPLGVALRHLRQKQWGDN